MKDICEYADKSKKIIILSPSDEFSGNKKRLIEFYKRFGFVDLGMSDSVWGGEEWHEMTYYLR